MRQTRIAALVILMVVACGIGRTQNVSLSERLEITEADGAYSLTVPVSELIMTVPKGELVSSDLPGSPTSPRYFSLTEETSSLIVSDWFEPEQSFKGIKQF